jgi:predicted homoserine dehydrogenase-like protein
LNAAVNCGPAGTGKDQHEKTVKVGVIGVGYLGRFHAQKYAAMENVELVGVGDVDAKRAQLWQTRCHPSL